jgi:type IV pilus assembly protein PilW
MSAPDRPCRPHAQRGLSIVEVMVGMIVALLVGLAATSSARVFTASQRQGMAAGGMAIGAASALAAIKSDLASAGLGFFGDSSFKCYQLAFSVDTSVKFDGGNFTPSSITRVGTSDRIDVLYSTSIDAGANVLLSGASNSVSANLLSLLPVSVGDAVLLAPATAGTPCLVRTVTGITASTATTPQILAFANTGTYNKAAFTAAPTFTLKDTAVLLGQLRWSRYSMSGTNLQFEDPANGTSAVLMRNVMAFRAQYGISANAATPALSGWQDATGGTWGTLSGANVDRVRAMRIGIVTRSAQREKENSSGVCEASTAKPTDPFDTSVTVEPDVTDWQCYRYRTVVSVVPLRNLVMGMTP